MLEIRPVADPRKREVLAARFHLPYQREDLLYAADEDGTVLSVCRFRALSVGKADFSGVRLLSLASAALPKAKQDLVLHRLLSGVIAFCLQNHGKDFELETSDPLMENALSACGLVRRADGIYTLPTP